MPNAAPTVKLGSRTIRASSPSARLSTSVPVEMRTSSGASSSARSSQARSSPTMPWQKPQPGSQKSSNRRWALGSARSIVSPSRSVSDTVGASAPTGSAGAAGGITWNGEGAPVVAAWTSARMASAPGAAGWAIVASAPTTRAVGVAGQLNASATSRSVCSSTRVTPCSSTLARLSSAPPRDTTATVSRSECSRCQRPISGRSASHGPQPGSVKSRSTGRPGARSSSSVTGGPSMAGSTNGGAGSPTGRP